MEKSRWFPLGKSLLSPIQMTVIEKSGITTSFTLMRERSAIDRAIDKPYNQLLELLELTADA